VCSRKSAGENRQALPRESDTILATAKKPALGEGSKRKRREKRTSTLPEKEKGAGSKGEARTGGEKKNVGGW